jgi:putative SOS response-associated peptidase YedK
MCGRFTLTTPAGLGVAQRFETAEPPPEQTLRRFNVCPTEQIAVVRVKDGERRMAAARWGLVPSWAKALGVGREPINARSETAAGRRPFADLFARADRRCLVPADGWYEWLRAESPRRPRVPFRYTVDGGELFAFAGLLGVTRIADDWVVSATILTTRANGVCAPVHDRMPCVLAGPEEEAAWLAGDDDPQLLVPCRDERVTGAPVNPAVNRAGVEGPQLLEPPAAPPPGAQQQLAL